MARPSAVDVAATLGHHLLWLSSGEASMPAQTTNLFLLEDLEDSSRTRKLADSDLNALRAVADWIKAFVARPNKDLGRPGPVCPFVGGASEGQTLWLTPEQIANQSVPDVVQLMNGYKKLLLRAQPTEGDDANYKAILVVFTDLSADRAKDYMDDTQIQDLKKPEYAEDGLVLGEFYEGNEGVRYTTRAFDHSHPRAVSVSEACGHQRLEVLLGQRRLIQPLGASLWSVRSPGSC